jgi:hypothetical protein
MPRTRSSVRKANSDNRRYLDNLSIRIDGEQLTQEDFEDNRDIGAEERMATINPMNVWSKSGLDLTDSTFAKIYESVTKFHEYDDNGDSLKKFKLNDDRFEELRGLVTRKVNKLAMRKLLKLTQGTEEFLLVDQAPLVTEETMIENRDSTWADEADPTTTMTQADVNNVMDKRIKCHAFGTWLQDSLTTEALTKLEYARSKFSIIKDDEPYLHGPILWWYIVTDIKPNNDTLIQNAKEELNSLDVKNFNFSVKEMLTQFDNIVVEITARLKGTITEDEHMTALWKCVETMPEEKFAKTVWDEKRSYRKATAGNKAKSDQLIALFKNEQTNMEADKIWNKPSTKDQQIIALTSMLKTVFNNINNAVANNSNLHPGSKPNDNSSAKKFTKKGQSTPPWKFENPDKKLECDRDGKHWWWCPKHYNPNEGVDGMWVRHKPEDHRNEFKPQRASNDKENAPPTDRKRSYADAASEPAVKVDDNMFQALKSGADIQVFLNKLASSTNTTDLN